MADGTQRRQFQRYELPFELKVPGISGGLVRPVNLSAGGFMVELEDDPQLWAASECSVAIDGSEYKGEATVVWKKKNLENQPPNWSAGLLFEMPGEKRVELGRAMEAIQASLDKASLNKEV
ncbi:MAG: hypothetical protein CMH76_01925 [Nitrospinae bacterium]|nr:hypothetical protein [Nitrospinota bacterium]